jgi:hypothetical protein
MKPVNTCRNCSMQLMAGHTFCKKCGSVVDTSEDHDETIECETHPDHYAVGICVICGRPVCSDCEVKSNEKILCHDPEHKIALHEWCAMVEPGSEFEAVALVRNLSDGGIEAKAFSLHDHVATHWLEETHILLFVKTSECEKGKALLQELNLIGND